MFWRKKSSSKEKDYEKLLEDIDFEIKKIEENLRQIKIREDRRVVTWLYYSIPLYSVFFIGYCFYLYNLENPWPVLAFQATPLLLGLFIIIFIKKFISIWFKKQQMKEEERCSELKKEQKEILEELKSKLKYYQTKNLIEKYEFQDDPTYPLNNNGMPMINTGMPVMYPQMNINGQRINQNQMRNSQMMAKKQQLMGNHNLSKQRSMPVVLQNGKQQFPDMRHNQQYLQQYGNQSTSNPNERKWIDKLMDVIIGDVNEVDSKYALICNFCYTHCGLALPEEYKTCKYICPNCKKLNDNTKKYSAKDPKKNQKSVDEDHLLASPPSAPVEKTQHLNVFPINTQNKSAPASPQKSSFVILNNNNSNNNNNNNNNKPSTLLDRMDDSTNTDVSLNQTFSAPINDNSEDIINEEINEDLNQDINNDINYFEEEIEQKKEYINNQPENDIDDNIDTIAEESEEIKNGEDEANIQENIQYNNEIINDNKKESLSPVTQEQNIVDDNKQKIEEKKLQ